MFVLAEKIIEGYRNHFDEYSFSRGLERVWELISRVNKYIVENEPWAIAGKPEKASQLDSVLFHAAESLRVVAALLAPVIPQSAQVIWQQLGLDGKVVDVRLGELHWSDELSGKSIRSGTALFPRLDPKEVFQKLDAALPPAADSPTEVTATAYPELAATISIDDFAKIDLRVATVLEAEKVKGADKLLRLIVDLGFEKRQILAGIAKSYDPEKLIGRKVAVVANLAPRKMRGLESNGMIVAASLGADDPAALVSFLENVQNGARLR